MRRRRATIPSSGGGSVRSRPDAALAISRAASRPVSSEICAFHVSTGSGASSSSENEPAPVAYDLLAGRGDAHAAALPLAFEQALPDLPEQREPR